MIIACAIWVAQFSGTEKFDSLGTMKNAPSFVCLVALRECDQSMEINLDTRATATATANASELAHHIMTQSEKRLGFVAIALTV